MLKECNIILRIILHEKLLYNGKDIIIFSVQINEDYELIFNQFWNKTFPKSF